MGFYDVEKAVQCIAAGMRRAGVREADDALHAWIRRAIDADLAYMKASGAENGGEFDSDLYDPDDACDFIYEALSEGNEEDEEAVQALLMKLDAFMDAELAYLEELGDG